MITQLQIESFKSFKKLELEMRPLNVLIGPNAGGKTNFLDFFRFLREAFTDKLSEAVARRGGIRNLLYGEDKENLKFHITCHISDLTVCLQAEIAGPLTVEPRVIQEKIYIPEHPPKVLLEKKEGKSPRFSLFQFPPPDNRSVAIYRLIGETTHYAQFNTEPISAIRSPQTARGRTALAENGSNLTSVLQYLANKLEYRPTWVRIKEILSIAYPNFEDIYFPAEGGDGNLVLRWKERTFEKRDFSANFLSDGTLHFLCLLAILLNPAPPPLICIDEPELGLHPALIRIIAELLKDAATRTQLVVATHSPELVSHLEPEDILIVENIKGATEMRRLSSDELKTWLKEYTLAELWLARDLGGNP